jgi:hypothetical protein
MYRASLFVDWQIGREVTCLHIILVDLDVIKFENPWVILFLILRVKHRLRVFEKRVLRRIFSPKWKKVT